MNIQQAATIAQNFATLIAPACERVTIAGSVRRGKPEVKDIEIVAVAKVETRSVQALDLFGTVEECEVDLLAERIDELITAGTLTLDTVVKRNGPKYKRFMTPEGIACELFIAEPDNFGNILAIRTGKAEFSKALVTSTYQGGYRPPNMEQRDGYLWRSGRRIACPSEESFFAALGMKWLEPSKRTVTA